MRSMKKLPRSKARRRVQPKMTLRAQAFMAADLLGEDAEQWYRDLLSARRLRRRLRAAMTAAKRSASKRCRGPKEC